MCVCVVMFVYSWLNFSRFLRKESWVYLLCLCVRLRVAAVS